MTFPRLILRPLLVLAALVAGSGPGRAASTPTTPLTAEEQRLIAAVEAGKDDFGSALGQAVQIDSATENLAGVRQLGELFAQQLTELGFESRFVPLPASTGRAGHLVAEHRGTKGQRVLLIGHLDTVYPGANFTRAGDEVAGAGVADVVGATNDTAASQTHGQAAQRRHGIWSGHARTPEDGLEADALAAGLAGAADQRSFRGQGARARLPQPGGL